MLSSRYERRKGSITALLVCLSLLLTAGCCSSSTGAVIAPPSASSTNPAGALVGYVVSSFTKTIDGVGELWSNHGRCNEIRKKISTHRDAVKATWEDQAGGALTSFQKEQLKKMQAGISFEEYVFLQKGKEDRGKVFNLLFLMWGAPKFLPYALLFNPGIMPSPFKTAPADGVESTWDVQSRQRSAAVLQALVSLEQATKGLQGSTGFSLAKLNIFNKKEQAKQQSQLVVVTNTCAQMLRDPNMHGRLGAERLLNSVPDSWLYKRPVNDNESESASEAVSDFDRGEKRLAQVPKPIVKGLTDVLSGGSASFFAGIQPHFLTRGRLLGHVAKVEQADDFLVGAQINLATISKKLLREACSDRFFDNPTASEEELRQQLTHWLELTVHEPAMKLKHSEALYHNGNMARMVLMAYNSLISTRAPSSASTLPRLLYSASKSSDNEPDNKHGLGFRKR